MADTQTPAIANPEKAAKTITISHDAPSGATTPGTSNQHHFKHSGRRLRQFLHPSGRRVHVAASPEEASSLSRRLTAVPEQDGWDVYVQGSPEHVEALRQTHSHFEQQRESIRRKLGDEAANEFESVIRDLDSLSNELHTVTEHTVHLDANFSKFGYSAHLRARDSPEASRANSLYGSGATSGSGTPGSPGDDAESHRDWEAERHQGSHMFFYKRAIMRQYFHKGLLWRSSELQETMSYELFVDLLYVGIVAITGDVAAEQANGQALLRFAITFIMGWKFWSDITIAVSWFDSDSIIRRLSVLFMLTCLLGLTTNMAEAWEMTYVPLVSFYIAGRWFNALYLLAMAFTIPLVKEALLVYSLVNFFPGIFWIASCHVEEPNRQALIWIALFFDLFGGILFVLVRNLGRIHVSRLSRWADKQFEYFPGMNIEHTTDRTGAFVTLIIGYSVIALLYQSSAKVGINAFFGKAVLGLVQAFAFNWLYFEVDSFNIHTHAIRRQIWSAAIWTAAHLPFIMGFALAGSALSKLVLAHDSANADPHDLWETYEERSEEELSNGLRWFYCAGLGISLASMSLISACHDYKTRRTERLTKPIRLAVRFAIALIILLLPLAHELNSLHLIAITTCLTVLALTCELAGSTCIHEQFWVNGQRRQCTYSAKTNLLRKDLQKALDEGELENVARRGGEKQNFNVQV